MAKKRDKTKQSVSVIDLQHLRQVQLAWLIGRPPRWIREHSHIFERDSQGFYSGRQAVMAMLHYELSTRPPTILY